MKTSGVFPRPVAGILAAVVLTAAAASSVVVAAPPALPPATALHLVPSDLPMAVSSSSKVVHAYGTQLLVSGPQLDFVKAQGRSRVTQLEDVGTLSYRAWKGAYPAFSEKAVQAYPDGYYIAALAGPLDPEWASKLSKAGLTIVDAASPYGLVLRGDGKKLLSANQVRTSRGYAVLRGVTPVPDEARLDPTLSPLVVGKAAPSDVPGLRRSADGRAVVRVFAHADQKPTLVADEVAKLVDRADPALAYGHEDAFLVKGAEIATVLGSVPGVALVEGVFERELHNNIAVQGTVMAVEPVWNLGWNGAGIIVDHNDSGVDLTHPDFPSGTILATSGAMSGTDNGHGTHTAGSVAGRGVAGTSPTNTSGCGDVTPPLGTIRGAAWGANLVVNNIFDGGITTEAAMMQWGYVNGARLSTNSWGYGENYYYASNTAVVDGAVRDANGGTAGNQELSILVSAGNYGPTASTIGIPGNGKNVITVGASQNDRCGSYVPSYCAGPSINSMACFSSRGPAQGRIKPDVVAPGADIISTQSADSEATHPWDQTWTGARYELSPGTSMSCPLAAGATAAFFQFYGATFGSLPSPALAKAAIVNGAVDMGLGYPSNSQGWGRLNLERSIQGPPGGSIEFIDQDEVTPLATGATWSRTFPVSSSAIPLEVTLAWTDPPGAAGCTSCLVNNLNLVVTSPTGIVYRGNQLTSSWSTPNPGATTDTANNLEVVLVQSPAVGTWTMQVTSASTATNPPGLAGQDFAVAYSGAFCALPNPPTGTTAIASGTNRITVGWTAPGSGPVPTEYRILRSSAAGGPYAQIGVAGAAVATFVDEAVSGGTTYYYVVRSFNSCESANSTEASATATGTCTVPPTFAGLSTVTPTSNATCTLTLAWSAGSSSCGGSISYQVYRGAVGFTPGPENRIASDVTGTSYVDSSGLASGTTYEYVVRAIDSANLLEDGSTVRRSGMPQGVTSTVTETFEAVGGFDNAGWTHASLIGSVDWVWSNARSQTPTHSWFSASQTTVSDRVLVSPSFVVGSLTALSFWHSFAFEGSASSCWDAGTLEISTNGGSTWTVVPDSAFSSGGFTGTVASSYSNPIAGKRAWCGGTIGALTQVQASLAGFAGSTALLRWREGDDSSVRGTGWYVDSVTISGVGGGSCASAAGAVQFFSARGTGSAGTGAGTGQVELMWWTPEGSGANPIVRIRRKAAPGAPSGPNDATSTLVGDFDAVGWNAAASAPDDASPLLANDTTYNYAAYVSTDLANWSTAKAVSVRPQDTTGNTKWVYSTGASTLTAPGRDAFVYVASNDRILHAVNGGIAGGTWPSTWKPMVMNAPAQDRFGVPHVNVPPATKVIFLGAQDGKVRSVDAETGALLRTSSLLTDSGGMLQGAIAGNYSAYNATALDLVFAATRNATAANRLWALDMVDLGTGSGTSFWFDNGGTGTPANAFGIVSSQPSVDYAAKRIYFTTRKRAGGSQQTVWCVSFSASAFTACPGFAPSTAIGDVDGAVIPWKGYLYVGDNEGTVWVLDANTGATKKSFATGDGPVKGFLFPQFAANPMRLYCSTNSKVWAFTWDGTVLDSVWKSGTGGVAIGSPSIPTFDGTSVFVGSNDGRLHQLTNLASDPPTHTSLLLGPGTGAVGSPTLDYAVPNLLYVGTDAGLVYAVQHPIP